MLSQRFLQRLEDAFPHFYDRANADAMEDAQRILRDTGNDVQKALARARLESAARLWWPYVKGSVPVVGKDLAAMEAFTRLVLTVDHVVGHPPADLESARTHVLLVLRSSLDVERLRSLVRSRQAQEVAGAGLAASIGTLLTPISMLNRARTWGRFVPAPVRITIGAVIVAALLSIPFVAGYSAGHQAEKRARAGDQVPPVDTRGRPVAI